MNDSNPTKPSVVAAKYVAMFKRQVPQHHYITKSMDIKIDFEEIIKKTNPILFKKTWEWPKENRDKLDYYLITPTIFNKIIKNETHYTYYELLAIADIIGCDLEIIFKAKKK